MVVGVVCLIIGLAVAYQICKLHSEGGVRDTLQVSIIKLFMGICWVVAIVLLIVAIVYLV